MTVVSPHFLAKGAVVEGGRCIQNKRRAGRLDENLLLLDRHLRPVGQALIVAGAAEAPPQITGFPRVQADTFEVRGGGVGGTAAWEPA